MDQEQATIRHMTAFGGSGEPIDYAAVTDIKQLPKSMQLTANEISETATYANFICYCDKNGIESKYAAGVSGFDEKQVKEIIEDAKSLELYDELANGFLKQR